MWNIMNNINTASASDQHLLCLQTRWLIIIKCFQFYRVLQVGSCQPQSTRLRDFLSTNIQRFSSPLPLARLTLHAIAFWLSEVRGLSHTERYQSIRTILHSHTQIYLVTDISHHYAFILQNYISLPDVLQNNISLSDILHITQ